MSSAKKIVEVVREQVQETFKIHPVYLKLNEIFPIRPLESKAEHKTAMRILERLVDYTNENSSLDEGVVAYLRILSEIIEEYELKHYPVGKVSGAEMLAYIMELQGLKQSDLKKELGGQSVVSDILTGKRELNLKQIRALAKRFKISPNVFI